MQEELKIISENFGKLDPLSINEYIAKGGFDALKKSLHTSAEKIVEEIALSGLRGRGGAGFPTGLKWKYTANAAGTIKYAVCNADEGEPGTFKDKRIMELDPFSFLEGLIIAAYSIGAIKAYVYIRGEYYLSTVNTQNAIDKMYENGFLGKNILGSVFSLDMEIKTGAGSYLCGEELTLIESLEGKRGYPRIKPPFPAEKGILNKPTLVNNVETLANIPHIIKNGHEWFKSIGTEKSPGTKLFCISGDVNLPGCYEATLGTPLTYIINDFAGGIKNGLNPKAFLLGGAAGTFIPANLIDIRMDYESLSAQNATLGSGAIIVLNESRSVSAMLGSIIRFFKHESCGKCVPCRTGCHKLLKLWEKSKSDSKLYYEIEKEAMYIAQNSLCPLGQSPLLPIRSALGYFSSELLS